MRLALFALSLAFLACGAQAQENWPPISAAADGAVAKIAKHPPVVKALEAIRGDSVRMFEEQVRITEIPAPPFKEEVRARYYLKKLQEAGLADARIDKEGNVVGVRRGTGRGPRLVVSAHLDTVFPEGTDVKVREKGGRYYGPGISDDAAGLTSLLTMIMHLNRSGLRTVGDIIAVGTVGEEELGNLRGVKALFRDDTHIDGFISLEGAAVFGRIVNHATGSHRFLVDFRGPGGHSFGAFGVPSAIHAMGRAIAKIGDLKPPVEPKTTFTVGVVKGGTSVNAIAGDATMSIDIRSNSPEELLKFEKSVMAAIHEAAAEENKRWNSKAISVETRLVGDRPAGMTSIGSPIVHAARAAFKAVGAEARSITAASTDSNLPMSLGIPAITLSSAGQAGGSHSLGEWYTPTNNWYGPQVAMMLSLGLVGVEGVSEPLLERRGK